MRVAFFDLARRDAAISQLTRNAISEALSSGQLVGGRFVERFEADFADYIGAKYCVATSNGLDSLRLMLQGLGVGPGDEVIVPAQTFIATWLAASQVGAQPIPVDIDEFGLLDPAQLRDRLTPRTKVVIPVHLFGSPCDLDAIRAALNNHPAAVIEDAAQAHGATYKGKMAGSLADGAAFSFYPTKNLGAVGDAGAIVTDNADLAAEVRSLQSYGMGSSKYEHVRLGWNCRMDAVQAAILSAYLPYLDEWNARRGQIAKAYDAVLAQHDPSRISRVSRPDGVNAINANHLFVLRTPNREALRRSLDALGVQTDIHYPSPPFRSALFQVDDSLSLKTQHMPQADALAKHCLSLPMHPWLSDQEVTHTCNALLAALKSL